MKQMGVFVQIHSAADYMCEHTWVSLRRKAISAEGRMRV